ncbi:MAG: hypothetical protein FJY75_09300 [Candidatus Eisenbacteria bacterium]|uniref:Uncharacterized protein n=1 Tax=Eiseniibacteriota bacterium TaxID=2212470 RepID=A0A938BP71_UNCEI|nr:hypothetical protein [Candidatus Eisenbacteria bacterium]
MTHTCLRNEELSRVAFRAEGDPLRLEAEACARCRSRLAAYHEFLHPSALPAGALPDEADELLAARLAGAIPGGEQVRPFERHGSASGGAARRPWMPRLLPPALTAAALLVMIWVGREAGVFDRRGGDEILLREEASGAPATPELDARVVEADAGLRLSWSAVAGADRYEVDLHGEDFREIERFDAGSELSLALPAGKTAPLRASGEILLWRVTAYGGGDAIAQSRIRPLELPPAP